MHNNGYQFRSWSAEQGTSCSRSRMRIWSRETGSAVSSRVAPLILHTQAECGACSMDFSHFPRRRLLYREPPPGQSRAYQVTQLRSDGVYHRESTGTGLIFLKVASVTSAAYIGNPTDQLMRASLFPRILLVLVDMRDTHSIRGICMKPVVKETGQNNCPEQVLYPFSFRSWQASIYLFWWRSKVL